MKHFGDGMRRRFACGSIARNLLTKPAITKTHKFGLLERRQAGKQPEFAEVLQLPLKEFVEAENMKHPDDKYELKNFNTTFLIAALKFDDDGCARLVTFSVGDGAIAWYAGNQSSLMCLPDGGEYSGGTRFLTSESVWKKAREDWSSFCNARVFVNRFDAEQTKQLNVFLMTDGVSDPMFETDAGLENHEKWRHLAEDELKGVAGIVEQDTAQVRAEKMLRWLDFWSVGNHDDRTIIAVYPHSKDVEEVK